MCEDRLLPCPFCGGKVSVQIKGTYDKESYFIRGGLEADFNNCHCNIFMDSDEFDRYETESRKSEIKENLIAKWNRRTNAKYSKRGKL